MTHGKPCGDTWQAMCHNAWERHACVTHGMPCVNMHGSFEAYIRDFTWAVGEARRAQLQSVGAARRRRRKGKEKGRKGEEKGRKGKEKRRKRKEKERRKERKKEKEERERKEEKEGVSRSEQTRTAKNPELHYKR